MSQTRRLWYFHCQSGWLEVCQDIKKTGVEEQVTAGWESQTFKEPSSDNYSALKGGIGFYIRETRFSLFWGKRREENASVLDTFLKGILLEALLAYLVSRRVIDFPKSLSLVLTGGGGCIQAQDEESDPLKLKTVESAQRRDNPPTVPSYCETDTMLERMGGVPGSDPSFVLPGVSIYEESLGCFCLTKETAAHTYTHPLARKCLVLA